MNIAIYYPGSPFECGGIGNWIFEVTKKLSVKHEITLIGLKQALSKEQSPQRISQLLEHNVQYLELPQLKLPIGVALPHPFCIGKLVKSFNSSDVVYVIVPSYPTEALLFLLKTSIKTTLIAGFHGQVRLDQFKYSAYLPIFKQTLDAFHVFHALNQQTYAWLRNLGLKNINCIPNGVDTKVFKFCEHSRKSKTFNILYVGWLMEYKGISAFLKIARHLSTSDSKNNIRLVVCGSGPLEPLVEKASREYGNIEYLGYVPSESMHEVYGSMHLFLFPSSIEGMPLSLLEAQSCGLPVVGSNIPGVSEIICDENGKLVNVGDLEGFIIAIEKYYALWRYSPEEYYRLNRHIRERTTKLYDWAIVVDRFEKMLTHSVHVNER